jgi:hypothetical protein
MKRRLLFLIETDPRLSPRPAEAVRIAAGLAPWPKIQLLIYLRGPAVGLLSEAAEDWPDGDHYAQYLPLLASRHFAFWIQSTVPISGGTTDNPYGFELDPIDDPQLAARAATCHALLRF